MTDGNAHITYSFADIEHYLNGSMTAKEMHDMERAALQDPFLADAIEGYRGADTKLADKHLNEIAAGLQKDEPAKVILMPKKKQYSWLAAASVLAVIGAGIFLFIGQNESSKQIAMNAVKKEKQQDSAVENLKTETPRMDSQRLDLPDNLAFAKAKKETDKRTAMLQKKKPSAYKEKVTEPQQERAEASSITMAAPALPASSDHINEEQKQAQQPLQDSTNKLSLSSGIALTKQARGKAYSANSWTTDKGKPFLLSDVEVINLDSKKRVQADTTAIKPEGGWQSFHNYLFSRLSKQDSLLLVDNDLDQINIELEFSVDKSGLPYDIKVLHAQDSLVTNKIVTAIQSGPKWTSGDNKEKRLRIHY